MSNAFRCRSPQAFEESMRDDTSVQKPKEYRGDDLPFVPVVLKVGNMTWGRTVTMEQALTIKNEIMALVGKLHFGSPIPKAEAVLVPGRRR